MTKDPAFLIRGLLFKHIYGEIVILTSIFLKINKKLMIKWCHFYFFPIILQFGT